MFWYNYAILIAIALFTAFGSSVAERGFKGRFRPWILGGWFGFLSVVAGVASFLIEQENNVTLPMQCVPIIVSALFFGAIPGIVSGAIITVLNIIALQCNLISAEESQLTVLLIALIVAATRKWFLDDRRPNLFQSLLIGVVLSTLHISIDVLFMISELSHACEIVYLTFLPKTVSLALALALSCVILKNIGSIKTVYVSQVSRFSVAFISLCSIIILINVWCSESESHKLIEGLNQRLKHLLDSQINYMLHQDAYWIAQKINNSEDLNLADLGEIVKDTNYDEYNIVDKDGKIVLSFDPNLVGFDFHDLEETRKYLRLLKEPDGFLDENFHYSYKYKINPAAKQDNLEKIKYIGFSLPETGGFIQLGFALQIMEQGFQRFCFPLFENMMNFYDSDYNLIASTNDWRVVLDSGNHTDSVGKTIQELHISPNSIHARLFGEWCYVGMIQVGEWCIFCIVPIVEAYGESLIICAALMILVFCSLFFVRVSTLRYRRQQAKIDALRAEADAKQQQDLESARKIQRACLPLDFPNSENFAFFAKMVPAKIIGGDFYDFYSLKDGRIMFTVADVSGKGIPAAMFMMRAKLMLKYSMGISSDIAAAFAMANEKLNAHNEAEMFVTVWSGIFDPATNVVEYVNAGHNPPLIRRADNSVEWLRKRCGIALGVFDDCQYRIERVQLAPGDSLLLYTDGVTEAENENGDFYGEDKIALLLKTFSGNLVEAVFSDVIGFAGEVEQSDDITALALHIKS